MLLSEGELALDEVIDIHDEYIENSDNSLGEFSFNKMYSLLSGNREEFVKLFSDMNLSIIDIIQLYNDDYDMFCAFANDNSISFFQEYGSDIDIENMVKIYNNNNELFFALINDENDMLQNIGVDDFIERYEQAQLDISMIPKDDPYSGAHDAYDFVTHDVIEDGCPDGWLLGDNSSDEESYDW